MASRVIHYLIASKIAESEGLDKDRFIVGALLPDLSKHEDGSYDRAHYWKEMKELGLITQSEIAEKSLLVLYPYEVIIEYIQNTINFCTEEIYAFYEGRESVNPKELYVRV